MSFLYVLVQRETTLQIYEEGMTWPIDKEPRNGEKEKGKKKTDKYLAAIHQINMQNTTLF